MALVRTQAEIQAHFFVLKVAVSFCAVSSQENAFSKRDDKSFLVEFTGLENQGIDKDIAGISQVRDGGGEETRRGKDCVIIPALDTETLKSV
jgi:hypothetical protein